MPQLDEGAVERPLRASDLLVLRELRKEAETRGVSKLSTRQLAELTGVTHKTVTRSLGRLASEDLIVKTQRSRGNHPAHWSVAVTSGRVGPVDSTARMTPRDASRIGTPDVFRRRDLQGPGALYDDLPDAGFFTAEQVLTYTGLTSSVRTVKWWLLVLCSQRWPMAEEMEPEADGARAWVKIHLEDWQLSENVEHINGTATALGRHQLKTKAQMVQQYQRERIVDTMRSAVPHGY